MLYDTVTLHSFINYIGVYEPGIVTIIMNMCGIFTEYNFEKNWLPYFQRLMLKNYNFYHSQNFEKRKEICKSVPIYKGTYLDFIESDIRINMLSRREVTPILNDIWGANQIDQLQHDFQFNQELDSKMNAYYNYWGLFERNFKLLSSIRQQECIIIFHLGFCIGDYLLSSANYRNRDCSKIFIPTHIVEIIPKQGEKIILKGYFCESLLKLKNIYIMTSKYNDTYTYTKNVQKYYCLLTGDL